MNAPFHTTRRVEWRDTDAGGIAHFTVFFRWMEEAEHELLRQLGLSVHLRDGEGVLSWPRVAASCQYDSPVKFEDVLDLQLEVQRLGEKSISYTCQFRCGSRNVARGTLTAVCCRLSADGLPRPVAIPASIARQIRDGLERMGHPPAVDPGSGRA